MHVSCNTYLYTAYVMFRPDFWDSNLCSMHDFILHDTELNDPYNVISRAANPWNENGSPGLGDWNGWARGLGSGVGVLCSIGAGPDVDQVGVFVHASPRGWGFPERNGSIEWIPSLGYVILLLGGPVWRLYLVMDRGIDWNKLRREDRRPRE